MKTLTNTRINDIHQRMVFRYLWEQGRASRTQVRDYFGFSKSTVSVLVNSLIDRGLIGENGVADSRIGRKPRSLSLTEPGPGIISIIMKDSGEITCGLVSTNGPIRHFRAVSPGRNLTPGAAIEEITGLIHPIFTEENVHMNMLGVGLGVPGIVDYERGLVEYSAHFSWSNVPVRSLLEAKLRQPLPVMVENRTIAATLGEMWYGKARNTRNFVTVNLGDALGAGIVIGGKVYRGVSCGVGEIGHIRVAGSCAQCSCGKRGCLEAEVSLPAILQKLGIAYQSERSAVQTLREHVTDQPVRQVLDHAYGCLGETVSSLINILAPERILFTGALVRLEPAKFLDTVLRNVQDGALDPLVRRVELSLGDLGEDQEILWGGAVVMEYLFGVRPVSFS